MPTYNSTHQYYYQDSGNTGNPANATDQSVDFASSAIFTDGNDDVWTVNEVVTDDAFVLVSGGNYIGTVNINGVDYPVIDDGGGAYFIITDTAIAPGDLPSDLSGVTSESFTACFAEGTWIATPGGEVAVETLKIGDMVLNQSGESVPVKWIGRQSVLTVFSPAERVLPIRFAAGSLGHGLPHADLTVTADHGMLVNGVICHAGALVNGTTITRVPLDEMGQRYTVYHVETENHEIILANGAPAETFIDNVSRRIFDNHAEFEALYGDVPEMEELPFPRAMSARQVPVHIRAQLGLVAAA